MSDSPTDHRPRFRLSLLNLLLITALAAASLAIATLWREVGPLRDEVLGYRQQLGYLTVPAGEADRVHAVAVESERRHEWRFRVFLPEGRTYRLYFREGELPRRTPELIEAKDYYAAVRSSGSGSSRKIDPGEHLLSFRVARADSQGDLSDWTFATRMPGRGALGSVTTTVPWMADERAWSTSTSMVNRSQKSFAADQPLPLLSVRRDVVEELPSGGWSATSPKQSQASDGFAWWIESP
ncbi:MAG: hypothetical protein AAFV43_15705 [Planctomycetota bacterium]